MALIPCPECSSQVSDKAPTCPRCGVPIAPATSDVKIRFPNTGQLLNTGCSVLVDGRVIASCRQGETVTFDLDAPREIQVKVGGAFGSPTILANPGERFEVGLRAWGKAYIARVDVLT